MFFILIAVPVNQLVAKNEIIAVYMHLIEKTLNMRKV